MNDTDYENLENEVEKLGEIKDTDLTSFVSNNALNDFLRSINKSKVPTLEENLEMYYKAINGDAEARDLLIERNMRLVLAIAYKNRRKLKSYEMIDVVQDGAIGLMTAIEKYDPSRSSFATCAVWWIRQAIGRGIDNFDNVIRISVNLKEKHFKYVQKCRECMEKGIKLPTDKEWLKILGVTESTFFRIKNLEQVNNVDSLDRNIESDSKEDSTLGNVVGCDEVGYKNVLDNIVNNELIFALKNLLEPHEFYILYYLVLSDEKKSIDYIVKQLGVSRQRIDQIKNKVLLKLKSYYNNGSFNLRGKVNTREVNQFRLEPVSPIAIGKYLYVRDLLSLEEQIILQEYFFGEKKDYLSAIKEKITLDEKLVNKVLNDVLNKIEEILKRENDLFQEFYKKLIDNFKTKIFYLDLNMDISAFKKSPRLIYYNWKDKSFDDLRAILKMLDRDIPKELERKLSLFFNYFEGENIHPYNLEIRLNRLLLDLDKSDKVSTKKLYDFYLQNMNLFEDNKMYKDALNVYFGVLSRREFGELYPGNGYHKILESALNKLNFLYFGFRSYRNYNFDRGKYLTIRDKCIDKMDSYYIEILDNFFGYYTGKQISQKELATILDLPLQETKERLRTAKRQAGNILADINWTMTLDMEIYKEYLLNNKMEFKEPSNTIVIDYIINGKSYQEIAKNVGCNTTQVSNAITDALWKIDKYRFGLNLNKKGIKLKEAYGFIKKEFLEEALSDSHLPITDNDKDLLRLVFGVGIEAEIDDDIIALKFGITKRSIIRKVQRALILIFRYKNKEIEGFISYSEDVEPNLKYFTKSDQEVLKMYYQDKLLVREMAARCKITTPQMFGIVNRIRIYLKDLLNGASGFDFDYFWEHINDDDVPIYGNKELAIKIFDLYFEKRIGALELEKKFDISENTIRRILMYLWIAIAKHKEGIKKIRDFSLEEVREYYNKNKDKMSDTKRKLYINYIVKMENPLFVTGVCPVPFQIAYDLGRNDARFKKLEDISQDELRDIVLANKTSFSERYLIGFLRYLGISTREIMSGKEKKQVVNFLMKLEEELELKNNKGVSRSLVLDN